MKHSYFFIYSILAVFLASLQTGFAKQPCCTQPCIDIMPCPVSEPVQMPVCDPSLHVYEVHGTMDYWTELMVPQKKPCEYRWDNFGFFWPSEDGAGSTTPPQKPQISKPGDPPQDPIPQTVPGRHITLRPIRVDVIHGTKVIAHQRRVERRRAHARGCFASPDLFIVEGIWFDK